MHRLLTYDPEADALTIELGIGRRSAQTVTVAPGILLDLDRRGDPISVEVLDASRRVSRQVLADLRTPDRLLTLREASRRARLTSDTLRQQVHAGRLAGIKQGRDWFVAESDLRAYLSSVSRRRRRSAVSPR